MAELENILVVSDLHFGEELLPGASAERRRAVELGGSAFVEFLRYYAVRRRDGRPWRLVIAGDLFDFMSIHVASLPDRPAKTADERRFGLGRGVLTGVERLRQICAHHGRLLAELGRFAAAGHRVEVIVGNHDVELLAPEVADELMRQIGAAGADARALSRIRVVPWFVYVPGVAWIEHGHIYDEGCSFEFNLSPMDPKDGWLIYNADYAAIRYLGTVVADVDPHAIEDWGVWGFMQYALGHGLAFTGRLWVAYGRFIGSLFRARALHRSFRRRDRRRREHRARMIEVARDGGIPIETAAAIDRMARTPMTVSFRRLGRMLMLDRFGLGLGAFLVIALLLIFLPLSYALAGAALTVGVAAAITRWLGKHLVLSQLPMRAVPQRVRKLVDAPIVVFGHTHDPRWQKLRSGGLYVNAGTWLPATRPGLRRSFTHVFISPNPGRAPTTELRQWRDGHPHAFDAAANIGAGGMTLPPFHVDDLDAPSAPAAPL